jgi:dolichol-phosphate mannosyltransferase
MVEQLLAGTPSEADAPQHGHLPGRRIQGPELSIVIPTFNEHANVRELVRLVEMALPDTRWELVFVDDNSPDGTASLVRELAQNDNRIRCIHRYGRRGLSSACVEGMMASSSPYVAVMDADLQHDERALPRMLAILKEQGADLAVGSRYTAGGGVGDWDSTRVAMSRFATALANRVAGVPVTDPMSGFFMLRREVLLDALPRLSSIGFKILLDVLASSTRQLRVMEVPYQFRTRQHGESKLDSLVVWEYLLLLLDKSIGRFIPVRFLSFAMVGGSGLLVHFSVLVLAFKVLGATFAIAQGAATGVAITSNFILNNLLTYRDRRLKGKKLLLGWVSFNLVSLTGAVANVGIANWMFKNNTTWLLSALAGVAVGVVWNYAVTSVVTWKPNK